MLQGGVRAPEPTSSLTCGDERYITMIGAGAYGRVHKVA